MDIKINGTSVTILADTLNIDDAIEERSTCSFAVRDDAGTAHYQKGQRVEIYDDAATLIYAGVIDTSIEERVIPGGRLYHQISCADWHYLADKRIAAKAYTNTLAGTIVNDMITSYLAAEGVTAGTIQNGPTVLEAIFNYVPVTQALDSLAEKAGFWWNIDASKALHFVSRSTNAAPWTATGDDMLAGSVKVEHGNPQYRNKQYIKGGRDITDPQTEIKVGDGQARAFTVGFPIAKVPTIEVSRNGGVYGAQTAGIKGVDSGKQWYWSKGDPVVVQADTETVLATTDKVRVTYQGEFDIVAITLNQEAIEDRKTVEGGGTGLVEDVDDEPNTTTREAAFQIANKKIERYGVIGRRLSFKTLRSGLKPGQFLTVNLAEHNLNNTEMLIESIHISEDSKLIYYAVTAVEGPVTGSWAKLFYAMATRGQAFVVRENIGEEQVLITLATFSKTWTQAESPNIFKEILPGPTLLPSATLLPGFEHADRVKYLAWLDGSGVEQGRKAITKQTGADTSQIVSTTYIAPWEANISIAELAWYGGWQATSVIGTGVQVDRQAYVKNKTELEALQVDKTDTKGW